MNMYRGTSVVFLVHASNTSKVPKRTFRDVLHSVHVVKDTVEEHVPIAQEFVRNGSCREDIVLTCGTRHP